MGGGERKRGGEGERESNGLPWTGSPGLENVPCTEAGASQSPQTIASLNTRREINEEASRRSPIHPTDALSTANRRPIHPTDAPGVLAIGKWSGQSSPAAGSVATGSTPVSAVGTLFTPVSAVETLFTPVSAVETVGGGWVAAAGSVDGGGVAAASGGGPFAGAVKLMVKFPGALFLSSARSRRESRQ